MTLERAISIRAAYVQIKKDIAAAGGDTGEIRSFSDLPAFLAGMVTEDAAEQALDILNNETALVGLLEAFSRTAAAGALVFGMTPPSDTVRGEDLYA